MPLRATWGSSWVGQEVAGVRAEPGQESLLWFLWEGKDEAQGAG